MNRIIIGSILSVAWVFTSSAQGETKQVKNPKIMVATEREDSAKIFHSAIKPSPKSSMTIQSHADTAKVIISNNKKVLTQPGQK